MTKIVAPHQPPSRGENEVFGAASNDHRLWMSRAVLLARSVLGKVWPNPPVGCVIVRDGKVVGCGRTQFGGRPHAERVALDDAGDQAQGASLYVTLEPCCHWGKTPPCADAIIKAGVKQVYASVQDPDPRVNGGGFLRLREAGIPVDVGLAAAEACEIMAGFFHRVATGRPLLRMGVVSRQGEEWPEDVDALVRSTAGGVEVVTRTSSGDPEVKCSRCPASGAELLAGLGTLGLTSVYLPQDDPLVSDLAQYEAGYCGSDGTFEPGAPSMVGESVAATDKGKGRISVCGDMM